jgi:hypothetical protein
MLKCSLQAPLRHCSKGSDAQTLCYRPRQAQTGSRTLGAVTHEAQVVAGAVGEPHPQPGEPLDRQGRQAQWFERRLIGTDLGCTPLL